MQALAFRRGPAGAAGAAVKPAAAELWKFSTPR